MQTEELWRWYRTMLLIRRFEETVDELYAGGKLYGTNHLYMGEEAVATGVLSHVQPGDVITSTHRGHGHNIALGGDIAAMMAELLGRETGYCHGRGGSMHIADRARGNLGANGIVAGGVPIAVGAGLGFRLRGERLVAIAFSGDGALNEGDYHEAVNLAAIWKLPVVFVVENNQYAMSGPVKTMFAVAHLAERAAAYGIPGATVDGMDVCAVAEAAQAALARARSGAGPSLLECVTYRYKGHSKSDANRYRTRDEIQEWRGKDPLARVRDALVSEGVEDERLDALLAEVRAQVAAAVSFAENSAPADPGGLESEVYASVRVEASRV